MYLISIAVYVKGVQEVSDCGVIKLWCDEEGRFRSIVYSAGASEVDGDSPTICQRHIVRVRRPYYKIQISVDRERTTEQ